MRLIIFLLLLLPFSVKASFLFNYGLNYSSENETSDNEYSKSRTFHKVFLGASVNGRKTVFFGWNINSWSSAISVGGGEEDTYSMLEMGPKITWFLNDNHNWYLTAEWNPYGTGSRTKGGQESDVRGGSTGFGLGYRYRISRLWGVGAGIHYHGLSLSEEKINNTSEDLSDKVTNIMPMLEISLLTK